jgi:glycosyltransferase involved in cell wall biosynthesis
MNTPLITVVTVVRNGVLTLEQTIQSVINQTYKNIEYIIIDGASTDGTVDIIKKYEKHLAYWVSEPDRGIYDAMNKGIDRATGEWVNFMNAGDWFATFTVIEKLINENIFENNCGAIIYGNRDININGILKRQIANLSNIKYCMDIFHQSCFIYTYLHKEYQFDTSYKICGDWDFFYRMINENVKFVKTDVNISIVSDGGISSNYIKRKIEDFKLIKTNNINKIHIVYFIILHICQKDTVVFLLKRFPLIYKIIRNIYLKFK